MFVINDILKTIPTYDLHNTAAFIASVPILLQCLCRNIQNKTWKNERTLNKAYYDLLVLNEE